MKSPKKIRKKPVLKIVTSLDASQVKSIDSWVSPYDTDKKVDWERTTPWKVTSEGARGYIILRYVEFKDKTGTKERFDRAKYDFHKSDELKCKEICRVLNYRIQSKLDARNAWIIKSEFLGKEGSELSQGFYSYMMARSSNEKHSKQCVRLVEMHFLNYFIYERAKPLYDYLEWHSLKIQAEYIEYILSKKVDSNRMGKQILLSVSTIESLIQCINHFFKYLHMESSGNIPLLVFTFPSITRARLVEHKAKRKENLGDKVIPKNEEYIDEATFDLIYTAAPDEIKSAVWLAYKFGLRRSEILGLELTSIKKNYLKVEFQLLKIKIARDEKSRKIGILGKKKGPLKNRDEEGRKVPLWYAKQAEIYSHLQKLQYMHPSGLTHKFSELMDKLGYKYDLKNLRNAFCSNALRDTSKFKISHTDVQLAMGHEDIRTTMGYLRDFRGFDDEEEAWTPDVG